MLNYSEYYSSGSQVTFEGKNFMNKIILSIAFLFSLSLSYADIPTPLEFPKGQEGPVQFFETPTRYIVVDPRACGDAKLCTGKVLYYQIDKKTIKPLVLTGGSTIDQGTGYIFTDPHSQKHYILVKISRDSVNAMSDPGRFYITDADDKILVKEETRFSTKDYI